MSNLQGLRCRGGEGEKEDEFLITRVEVFLPALNVVNCYGEQRNTNREDMEDKWRRLRKEMDEIRLRGKFCILAGDLNKLVGSDELGVPETAQKFPRVESCSLKCLHPKTGCW